MFLNRHNNVHYIHFQQLSTLRWWRSSFSNVGASLFLGSVAFCILQDMNPQNGFTAFDKVSHLREHEKLCVYRLWDQELYLSLEFCFAGHKRCSLKKMEIQRWVSKVPRSVFLFLASSLSLPFPPQSHQRWKIFSENRFYCWGFSFFLRRREELW
jgi:hypothetical protein